MAESRIRVAIAQINPVVGDFSLNEEKIRRNIQAAREQGAAIVVFPELSVTGYPPEDLLLKRHFVRKNLEMLNRLKRHTRKLMAVVGFVDEDRQGRLYNAAAVFLNGKIVARYHKVCLPNYGVFDEKRYFASGASVQTVKLGQAKILLTICEDIWDPNSFVRRRRLKGKPTLLVNISASPYDQGKYAKRQKLIAALAKSIRCPVVYANLVGGQDELIFDGGSVIVNASGRTLAAAKRFEEDLLVCNLTDPSGARIERSLSEEEEIYRALVLGTRDYIEKNGFKKVLIGLSGGIDSALVARIAVDALGPSHVIGVTMPSSFTSSETYRDAKALAANLGIACLEFSIAPVLKSYLEALKEVFSGTRADIAEENLQARIRGNLLMALSNKFGYLVLTTGNKSETATGYCTLYGDMAGGFAVIKDVPKTLVYRLVRFRNEYAPKHSIPESIIRRAPTAELRPNQKDQDTLPPYDVLDEFLEAYIEKDASLSTVIKQKIMTRPAAIRVARMVDRNEYKRRQAPPGIKITPKAFGRDRRMPITSRFSQ